MKFENTLTSRTQFRDALIINLGLLVLGVLLQYFLGNIPKQYVSFPYNIGAGVGFVLVWTLIFYFFKQKKIISLLDSSPFAIVTTIVLGFLSIGLGVFNVAPESTYYNTLNKLGVNQITTTWYFALIFFILLVNLWLSILKRALVFQAKNITFLLNHFGLWLALFAGVLGQGDLTKLKMTLQDGRPEWRAVDENGHVVELPLALELKKFEMEIYPNKLFLIDEKGETLPKSKPDGFMLEKVGATHTFEDWEVKLVEYVQNAVIVRENTYAKNPMWGATNAAKVVIKNKKTQEQKEEWISCGNFMFPPKAIKLSENRTLVMSPPEAKRYQSDVLIYQKESSKVEEGKILVNQPLEVNGWKIYQVSYNENLGRWSDISVLELVLDPWLPLVYIGIFILMLGTISFLFQNRK
ncbi:cytochrome c biogenesis protein ResB [Riemerella anatipestifer]|uniref:cytochrome c biogenesis protein ResB n=1 Tax=Riemerella anatipestifer TaxID=34085 RepID=UPI0004DC429A|nr:cytochrome c biogenesis protein ResB [Riemerella anatipestifer]AIH02581.1 hypothetical protein M949_1413 [Riemerella anatipestifer CH3]MCO7331886.1 cytochrome c biogenesis protein ResB [Riemerella anatipestifer]MCO7350773.1 cytochrome c biogenesis protein ResB [Riemerella anatipestifer]MCU7587175.1 cytochrome c biogenesis protein ResB [Riemerella anatipestifer]MCW0486414.1 cytochrome c biogenesis protein ResB [Riemerella anatipestifer]